jgi:diguanylate cyclase (GGDEF)-like protein
MARSEVTALAHGEKHGTGPAALSTADPTADRASGQDAAPVDLSAEAAGDLTAGELTALAAETAEVELLPRVDARAAAERAERLLRVARAHGLTELEMRAELAQAEVLQRDGQLAQAGVLARQALRWATENDATLVRARAHYVLQRIFLDLGDLSQALEHSLRAVELLDERASATMRLDHLCRLADVLGFNRDIEGARRRYRQSLDMAVALGDVDRELFVVNNWAYIEARFGDAEAALALSTRLREESAAHGRVLTLGRLDTIARTLIRLGRLAEAEEVLRPATDPEFRRFDADGDEGAEGLLALVQVQRALGKVEDAQRNLDVCVEICDSLGLGTLRVAARREQAELHAAAGDYRAAFEEHRVYAREALQLQSDERDARARTLQAVYETSEARQQSRRYRELSLRDPLTGLYNRRFVDEELPRLLAAAADRDVPVAVALLDLDHFKRVNDRCSHEVGDRVLQTVAGLLEDAATSAPEGSFAARLGGEEFLLVLTGGDRAATTALLQELCTTVRAHPWSALTGDVPVSTSIGAASVPAVPAPDASELLGRADACLYRAKRAGRDQVVCDLV